MTDAASPEPTIRLLVLGLGRQGRRHCLVAGRTPGVDLVATVDPFAAEGYHDTPNFSTIEDALGVGVDGAIVSTPTEAHVEAARFLLDAGVPTMVEKPLAMTAADATDLVSYADARGALLAVGHVERFNPAVQLVKAMLEKGRLGRPIAFSFRRLGLPPKVPGSVGVIHDLAVHDIDVFGFLVGAPQLVGVSRWPSGGLTQSAFLLLESGAVSGAVQVNWRTPVRVREFTITTDSCYVRVDYTTQAVELVEATDISDFEDFADFQSHYGAARRTHLETRVQEPLASQMEAFVSFVSTGELGALASGREGATAVATADEAAGTKGLDHG